MLQGIVPVVAQGTAPSLFGQRDFEMDWLMEPGSKLLRFRFHAGTKRLRIDALDGSEQTMHRDLGKGFVLVLVANGKRGAFAGTVPPLGAFQPQAVGEVQTVAGEACREFTLDRQQICVTADGIPVALVFDGGKATALRVLREVQPPALFEWPKGLSPKPLPGGGPGSLPKGLF